MKRSVPALPEVACLLVTHDRARLGVLERSIAGYHRQTWPNRRLVIVASGDPEYRARVLALAGPADTDVQTHFVDEATTLGAARNHSVDLARSPILCQWDDDDIYHPRRLEIQLRHMLAVDAPASLFGDQVQYFEDAGELLWIDWKGDHVPGTLMCRRECLLATRYPDVGRDEDGDVRNRLRSQFPVARLTGHGYLHVYTYNGFNVWGRDHHVGISRSHDPGFLLGREKLLLGELPRLGISPRDVRLVRSPAAARRAAPEASGQGNGT